MSGTETDIIARCPKCATAFKVTEEVLSIAAGAVRCGSCLHVFNARPAPKVTPTKNKAPQSTNAITSAINRQQETRPPIETEEDNKQPTARPITGTPNPLTEEDIDESWALAILAEEDPTVNISEESPEEFKEYKVTPANRHLFKKFRDNPLYTSDPESGTPKKQNKTPIANNKPTKKDIKSTLLLDDEMDTLFEEELDEPALDNSSAPQAKTNPSTLEFNALDDFNALEHDFGEDLKEDLEEDVEKSWEEPLDAGSNKELGTTSSDALDTTLDLDLDPELNATPDTDLNFTDSDLEKSNDPNKVDKSALLGTIQADPLEMNDEHKSFPWKWFIGAIVLGGILLLQLLWIRFDELSLRESYRPYYANACELLGCTLPYRTQLEKIHTTNLVVRSHPTEKRVLIADAIIVNTAHFEQPYPGLKLEFLDIDGRPVAHRDFQPRDYLRGELLDATIMPTNQPIQLSLAIIDPGERAVNYHIKVVTPTKTIAK